MSETDILSSRVNNVGVIRLNRPKARNALSKNLLAELVAALREFDQDDGVGAIVLAGNETTFCAGADIKEIKQFNFAAAYKENYLLHLNDAIAAIRKPIICVVVGYAFGGGCELAMAADIIYAAEGAKFGQPEVKIGTIPGAGGTQRLLRAVGKAKAMHMILTGDPIDAREAEAAGLVAKVLAADQVFDAAVETAQRIASLSQPVIALAKESVNQAEELGLRDGLRLENRLYHASFSLNDFREGMDAFVEKRQPTWKQS